MLSTVEESECAVDTKQHIAWHINLRLISTTEPEPDPISWARAYIDPSYHNHQSTWMLHQICKARMCRPNSALPALHLSSWEDEGAGVEVASPAERLRDDRRVLGADAAQAALQQIWVLHLGLQVQKGSDEALLIFYRARRSCDYWRKAKAIRDCRQ